MYADTSRAGRSFSVTLKPAKDVRFVSLYSYIAEPLKSTARVR